MNEYDVFLKLRSDRQAAARAYRQREFAREAADIRTAKPGWFRLVFTAAVHQIVKLTARRPAPADAACPTPPCVETLRAS